MTTARGSFELLAPPIQRILWDMRWTALRPIQSDSIQAIFQTDDDLIISAQTAAGKTEAAFLPVLSQVHQEPAPSIQALYVGPLKALINDQFRRLEDLCRRAEIPVHRWHGDVGAGQKKRMLADPRGVLLITPESIESLFVNRSGTLKQVFRHLRFVVIDEIHALVGRERGTHLRSLLHRLEALAASRFRIVGLSATLGDAFPTYAGWVRPDQPGGVTLITDPGESKTILYRIHAYAIDTAAEEPSDVADGEHPQMDAATGTGATEPPEADPEDDDPKIPGSMTADMFRHFVGKKNLIFANAKSDVELCADALNGECRHNGRPEEFLVHHGSLSKEVREYAEEEMRGHRPQSIVCSSTLELGIDIGNVFTVGQIGPPWSVASLVQRLGRSGRKEGEAQRMRLYVRQIRASQSADLDKRLYPDLLRAIALTELMLGKPRWVEPVSLDAYDFSTLTQQVLSVLAETGGIRADLLHQRLIARGAFRQVQPPHFARLLRDLAAKELIEQMPQGDIILAPRGEQIVGHYSFYSAFATEIELTVVYGSQPLGTLPPMGVPSEGDHLILAGRRWQVVQIDLERKLVLVTPARGRKPPRFTGGGGEIHARVRQMMASVLLGEQSYAYLNEDGHDLLAEARQVAHQAGLHARQLIPLSERKCIWFPWTGTREQRTLALLAEAAHLEVQVSDIALEFNQGTEIVRRQLSQLDRASITAESLARRIRFKQQRKYDEYISDDLLTLSLAHDSLDVPAALRHVDNLLQLYHSP